MRGLATLALFLGLAGGAVAQPVPFLGEREYELLVNEISGDAAYEHIRFFTHFHRPRGGAPGLMEVARYVEARAREFGLEEVSLIRQKATNPPWSNRYGEVWIVEPTLQRLASTIQTPLHLADYSRTAHLQAELVWVGEGTRDEDYQGVEVAGKIVLATGSPASLMREAVWERGALGVISYPGEEEVDHPDQIRWTRLPVESEDGRPSTFAFRLSRRQGVELLQRLQRERLTLKVDIESEFGGEPWQVMVEAYIRGTEIQDQDVVLTAHLQEEKFSANDDASGCASLLELARALKKLIDEGKLPRPRRNLRFWWVTEISSQRQYFADHPEAHRSMLVNINQDMVGADQSQDVLRVQNMTRVPFSRFHFLNDVAERWLEFVVESNRGNLAVSQAGSSSLYPRPILSRLGSRHRYHAEIIPFHNNTDHMTFNEAPIGVPGITFTNWPDHYIHTSDDDLWNIDRTQLQRNAFCVSAIAYTIAALDQKIFPEVAAEVLGRGLQRMAEDYRLAAGWLARSPQLYFQALHQLEEAYAREERALASLEKVAESPPAHRQLESLRIQLKETLESQLHSLHEQYRILHGEEPPREEPLSQREREMALQIPRLIAGPAEFLERRGKVRGVEGLHSLMAFEVLNFVDGRRSALEIYWAVAAQARRAGRHYYGEVSAEKVQRYLQNAREAGLLAF